MKIMVFSVYDSKTEVYGQPNFMVNRGAALRAWIDACNDPNTQIFKHPGDFTMFEIGEWDDEKGEIKMHPAKISLGVATEFKKQEIGLPHKPETVNNMEVQQ